MTDDERQEEVAAIREGFQRGEPSETTARRLRALGFNTIEIRDIIGGWIDGMVNDLNMKYKGR